MWFLDVLFNSGFLTTFGLYVGLVLAASCLNYYIRRVVINDMAIDPASERLLGSFVRVAVLIVFVHLSYPGLFGLLVAPSLVELISSPEVQFASTNTVFFLIALIFTVAYGNASNMASVLCVQGYLAVSFYFAAVIEYLGVTIATLWPGLDVVLFAFLLTYGVHRFVLPGARRAEAWLGENYVADARDLAVIPAIALIAQIPVILLLGWGLGRHVAL